MASRESVFSELEKKYSVDRSTSTAMVAYHDAFSRNLNKLGMEAVVADTKGFETKQGFVSDTAEKVSDIAQAIPGIGQIVSSLSSIVSHTSHGIEENSQKNLSEKVNKINPTDDYGTWCKFTRALADSVTLDKVESLKALTPEAAKALAAKDAEKVKKEILTRSDLPEISNQAELIGTNTPETVNSEMVKILTAAAKNDRHSAKETHHYNSMVDMVTHQDHSSGRTH